MGNPTDDPDFLINQFDEWKNLKGEVRNAFMTRMILRVFDKNSPKSESIFKIYEQHCTSETMKQIVKDHYQQYLNIKNIKEDSARGEIVAGEWEDFKSRFLGRNVVFEFWASWCQSCIISAPKLKALVENRNDIELVYIAMRDTETAWQYAIKKHNIKATHFLVDDAVYPKWKNDSGAYSFPYTIIVNKKGETVFSGILFYETNKLIEKTIRDLQ